MRYVDRTDAGRRLAASVARRIGPVPENALVLGVPRGGVVVAAEVATVLGTGLGVALGRKLGAPYNPELAIGAIGEYGEAFVDEGLVNALEVADAYLVGEIRRQRNELHRRALLYRGGAGPPPVAGRLVIVVDDGVATGATLLAVVRGIRSESPATLVAAAPVGAAGPVTTLDAAADIMVCPIQPPRFGAVGRWYGDFRQVTDDEVIELLRSEDGGPLR